MTALAPARRLPCRPRPRYLQGVASDRQGGGMLYTLVVKPIALGALALVVWVLWHAVDHMEAASVRRHRRMVGAGGAAIALLVLGPAAWAALRDRPGEVAAWAFWLAVAAAVVWGYARLVAAARRRAGRGRSEE